MYMFVSVYMKRWAIYLSVYECIRMAMACIINIIVIHIIIIMLLIEEVLYSLQNYIVYLRAA